MLEKTLDSPLDNKIKPVNPKGISPEYSLGGLMLKLKLNTLTTWCKELTHWKIPWCWARLNAGGEGDNWGWDGWMASLTRWTWVWVNSRNWWFREAWHAAVQRVRHDWATELNLTEKVIIWATCFRKSNHSNIHLPLLIFLKLTLFIQGRFFLGLGIYGHRMDHNLLKK